MGLLCLQKASMFPSRGEGASSDVGQWWYKGQMATTASTLSLGMFYKVRRRALAQSQKVTNTYIQQKHNIKCRYYTKWAGNSFLGITNSLANSMPYYTKLAGISFLSITNSLANSMPYLNEQYLFILIRCGYIRLL
uniref:Uncharacterized protein n=1 Tax=Helianthus annuus TaxID=4232 RepID=A0A251V5C9_HELAN